MTEYSPSVKRLMEAPVNEEYDYFVNPFDWELDVALSGANVWELMIDA